MESDKTKKDRNIDYGLMTATELATLLHISKRTLWRMRKLKSLSLLPGKVKNRFSVNRLNSVLDYIPLPT